MDVIFKEKKMINKLFTNLDLYQKGLEGIRLRGEITANNVANINTPGYKAKDVLFEDIFAEHIRRSNNGTGNPKSLMDSKFLIREKPFLEVQSEGNNVNMEKEMVASAKNNMMYDVIVKALNTRLNLMKNAIHEGKR